MGNVSCVSTKNKAPPGLVLGPRRNGKGTLTDNPLGNSLKDRKPTPVALDSKKGFATETRELELTNNDGKFRCQPGW